MNIIIVLMASGHNADIIPPGNLHIIRNPFQVSGDGSDCLGENLRIGKFRPVVHHYAAKVQMSQQRHQFPGHMSAAKDVDGSRLNQRLRVENSPLQLKLSCFRSQRRKGQPKTRTVLKQPHMPGGNVRQLQNQPAVPVLIHCLENLCAEFFHLQISWRHILKTDPYIPAADHSNIRCLVSGQGKALNEGFFLL